MLTTGRISVTTTGGGGDTAAVTITAGIQSIEIDRDDAANARDLLDVALGRRPVSVEAVIEFLNKANSTNIRAIQRALRSGLAFGPVKML